MVQFCSLFLNRYCNTFLPKPFCLFIFYIHFIFWKHLYHLPCTHNFPCRSSWQTFSYDSPERETVCPWKLRHPLMHPKVLLPPPIPPADPQPPLTPSGTHIQEGGPLVWSFQLFHSTDRLTFHYCSQAQPQCQDDFGNVQNTSLFRQHVVRNIPA